ncbi:echinoidin-like isoform X3 [Mytilus edulis]|uniref:echinoidin-like isoform X3 n=1 Tax=Mytilus edulis TaxID=6550 RepID=UPI0039F0684D
MKYLLVQLFGKHQTMSNCWYMIMFALSVYHVSNAGSRLTRRCEASNGRCGKNTHLSCSNMFGPGWTEKGKCCGKRSCCVSCPETVVNFGGSTYKFNCGKFTWERAKAYCESQNGSLTTIETKEENDFLKYVATLIQTTGQAAPDHWWLGLTDIKTEDTFEWISGQPVTYTDWFQGTPRQPDNVNIQGDTFDVDCASLYPSASFQWFDETCTFPDCQAVCEI